MADQKQTARQLESARQAAMSLGTVIGYARKFRRPEIERHARYALSKLNPIAFPATDAPWCDDCASPAVCSAARTCNPEQIDRTRKDEPDTADPAPAPSGADALREGGSLADAFRARAAEARRSADEPGTTQMEALTSLHEALTWDEAAKLAAASAPAVASSGAEGGEETALDRSTVRYALALYADHLDAAEPAEADRVRAIIDRVQAAPAPAVTDPEGESARWWEPAFCTINDPGEWAVFLVDGRPGVVFEREYPTSQPKCLADAQVEADYRNQRDGLTASAPSKGTSSDDA